jgi:tRNA pseudouridine-54 N-methylase
MRPGAKVPAVTWTAATGVVVNVNELLGSSGAGDVLSRAMSTVVFGRHEPME